ncbi:putative ketoreductase [Coniochaeta ligniaria NRRL 30616]|uniref:Putative ketoreductase n=1 Tax=Coniochaeta ligniaria NRRL 30616 TaxID=1408157 RepID=A0A1J7JN45_9PEZI|nr:putative ketoreductase [Coniochaeta ligniaria NRRL 30616]
MASVPSLTLKSGPAMPKTAYGTGTVWFKNGGTDVHRQTVDAIKVAIELGYRHFDCAEMYGTERELGIALAESEIPRADVFLTTKTTNIEDVEAALESSLSKLDTSYVDLFLIHSPFPATSPKQLQTAWTMMERCVERGLARYIGVSNHAIPHLQSILSTAAIKPAINQIEMHPYLQQPELLAYMRAANIPFAGYASLTPLRQRLSKNVEEVLAHLAAAHRVNESAVLVRWVLDQGASAVVTTSGNRDRLEGYLKSVSAFTLNSEEVAEISHVSRDTHFRGFFADEFRSLEAGKSSW